MIREKKVVIIAGPNGAGKTAFATEFLPNEASCPVFVNADLIAAGLSPFAPGTAELRAGRIMLGEIKAHVRLGENFAFETTLSGLMYARLIPQWQGQGYHVKLIYLGLVSAELAVARGGRAGGARGAQRARERDSPTVCEWMAEFQRDL